MVGVSTKIKFNCALPLVVSSSDTTYEVWVDFGETTQCWHVVAAKLGDRGKRSITTGNASRDELERAILIGVDLADDPKARVMASALVSQSRAELIEAA